MDMTSRAYLRSVAAPPSVATLTAAALGGTRPVRVKLVFLDELAAFVYRTRAFSACWYLLPSTARLVGDLLHEIAEEFELLERCPQGVELLLDGIHVLANQSIEMIRDNDTLAVQCVAFVDDAPASSVDGRHESRYKSKRKRGQAGDAFEEAVSVNKRSKREKRVPKEVAMARTKANTSVTNGAVSSSKKKEKDAVESLDGKKKKKVAADQQLHVKPVLSATPLDSSSSESSSSSSSSDDDDDDDEGTALKPAPIKATKQAFRKVLKETVKSMQQDVSILPSSSSSSDSSSSDSESDSSSSSEDEAPSKAVASGSKVASKTGKENGSSEGRTRRRRRPRRRPKNAVASTDQTTGTKSQGKQQQQQKAQSTATVAPTATKSASIQPTDIRPLRIRGVPPPAKNQGTTSHVRFDGPPKPVAQPTTSSDLHKYGPQSSNGRQPNARSHGPLPVQRLETKTSDARTSADEPAMKKPFKEMWKRPYEIISSIHDAKESTDKTNGKPTIESLLSAFPSKPTDVASLPTASGLQTDDIVAYKTLTLCMETFQPVVSEWQCGQAVDVVDADRSVTLIPYTWVEPNKSSGGKLAWKPAQPHAGEDACVCVSQDEISDVRYLHGPTKLHLATTTP